MTGWLAASSPCHSALGGSSRSGSDRESATCCRLPTRSSNEEFIVGLRNLGYQDGKDLLIERRYAEGRPERYRALAVDLARLPLDVIVADGSAATRAAKDATTTIPIVMVAADQVIRVPPAAVALADRP